MFSPVHFFASPSISQKWLAIPVREAQRRFVLFPGIAIDVHQLKDATHTQ
jgi:hypothetical protein